MTIQNYDDALVNHIVLSSCATITQEHIDLMLIHRQACNECSQFLFHGFKNVVCRSLDAAIEGQIDINVEVMGRPY